MPGMLLQRRASVMACKCADEVDGKLSEHNTRLERALVLGDRGDNPNLMLRTEQVERGRGKKKAAAMFISYCPFCGVKYNEGD